MMRATTRITAAAAATATPMPSPPTRVGPSPVSITDPASTCCRASAARRSLLKRPNSTGKDGKATKRTQRTFQGLAIATLYARRRKLSLALNKELNHCPGFVKEFGPLDDDTASAWALKALAPRAVGEEAEEEAAHVGVPFEFNDDSKQWEPLLNDRTGERRLTGRRQPLAADHYEFAYARLVQLRSQERSGGNGGSEDGEGNHGGSGDR
ncbi:unnamed protein product [Phaeothamnion confervicola]